MGRSHPLKKASFEAVAMSILEHIICRFGVPRRVLTDNGTPFVGKETKRLLEDYQIHHGTSTRYYPQGNGKVEAFNKIIVKILSKVVHEYATGWHEYLPLALWAYRTSRRTSTKHTPFSLVYGSEAVLPTEILVPTARLMLTGDEEEIMVSRIADLEIIEERRQAAQDCLMKYTHKMQQTYNKRARIRTFQIGDLVLLVKDHVMKGLHATKFTPNWEGPYEVTQIEPSGYCRLRNLENNKISMPTNIKFIKKYYP